MIGLDAVYKFSKRHHRPKPLKWFDAHCNNVCTPTFSERYRRKLVIVIEKLEMDINHYKNHFKTIIEPIIMLLPTQLCKCNRRDARRLPVIFPEDMKDPDALKEVMEMIRDALVVCDAKTRLEAVL